MRRQDSAGRRVGRTVSIQVKRYISLILLVLVASTAWTLTAYIWRDRTIRLLGMQGTDTLFSAARGERILSIKVAPERKLGSLEFRFRCLIERSLDEVPISLDRAETTDELIEACRPVSDRLDYFATMGAAEYAIIHEVTPENLKGHRLVFIDFGRIYASLFSPEHGNESLTTFAFLLNGTDHLVGYFEGYSEIMVMRGTLGRLLGRGEILDLVRVESGSERVDYVPTPGPDEFSLDDLPAWGQIAFKEVTSDQYGVTIVVREGMVGSERLLFAVETFADGNWFEESSGYWVIKTGRI